MLFYDVQGPGYFLMQFALKAFPSGSLPLLYATYAMR